MGRPTARTRHRAWAVGELTQFLELVAAHHDEDAAIARGLDLVVRALSATAGAMVSREGPRASLGFETPSDEQVVLQLQAVAAQASDGVVVPGVGRCDAFAVDLRTDPACSMVLVRIGEPFTEEEQMLALGMGRALSLVLSRIALLAGRQEALQAQRRREDLGQHHAIENERLLAMLEERQALLKKLARIQRSISTHAPLPEVYGAIVQGARDLLDVEVIGLRHLDPENPDEVIMVASHGMSDATRSVVGRLPVSTGLGGRAIVEGRLVVMPDYSAEAGGLEVLVAEGVYTAMSAPIHVGGQVVGSLTVGSTRGKRQYSEVEQEILLAFAEHASLALTDDRTLAAVEQALHDSLTGLAGRALFFDRLAHTFAAAGRSVLPFGMIFIDLDGFKAVNDRLGHAGGDQLLAEAASRIQACLREADTAARLGGDEFGVLIEKVLGIEVMIATAERIARAIAKPFSVLGTEVAVTAGIGVALSSDELHDGDELVRHADIAMYRAKRRGGDCVVVFDPSMSGQGQLS